MKELIREFGKEPEFAAFASTLRATTGRMKPLLVCGLCEGAEFVFTEALSTCLPENKRGVLLMVPDEKKARRVCDALAADGRIPLRYAARACLAALTASAFWLGLGCLSLDRKDIG